MPVISFFYSRWRPFFGRRSSEAIIKRAEQKGDEWVPRAKAAAASRYTLPPQSENGTTTDDNSAHEISLPSITQRTSSASR